jgi:hypothetical protein
VGEKENRASGTEYPHYAWKHGIKNVTFDESDNRYTFEPNHVPTASVADGVTFEGLSFEGWDMSIFAKDPQ